MIVLADDFTGALDTGVQFAGLGIKTFVTTRYRPYGDFDEPPQVLVLNLDSRHLKPETARKLVREISENGGAEYYYKKTDSGMRGNIGAELDGLLRQGERLAFVPAFPELGRTTQNGIHYFDGVPISRTVFGKDPFEPVTRDYIPDIIAMQSDVPVHVMTHERMLSGDIPQNGGILVFDAADAQQMDDAAKTVEKLGPPKFMAGCAGFAGYLPKMLGLKAEPVTAKKIPTMPAVFSGSINGITLKQVSFAAGAGFEVIGLSPEEKLSVGESSRSIVKRIAEEIESAYKGGKNIIVQAALNNKAIRETDTLAERMGLEQDSARQRIADNIGALAKAVVQRVDGVMPVIFGGDTLMAVMRHIGADGIIPIAEIEKGVVLSEVSSKSGNVFIITKSGGFGGEDAIVRIGEYLRHTNEHS